MEADELRVMVLVKAAPNLTDNLEEEVCVAAMTLDDSPRWVRLHPVPFRDLAGNERFKKYQEIGVRVIRPKRDHRAESYVPIRGSITLGAVIDTRAAWSERKRRVALLGNQTMCGLIESNRAGTGARASLGVVRPAAPPTLSIVERDVEQVREIERRAAAAGAQPSLFDDREAPKTPLQAVPWRFKYEYTCLAPRCNGHSQTIVDWEAVALWRRIQHRSDWREVMEQRFVGEMWASDRDSVLFVGNQAKHPASFLVVGVFWPPMAAVQLPLI